MNWMQIVAAIVFGFGLLCILVLGWCCLAMSSQCSRMEEERERNERK